jgi:hypothetical protein
LSEQLAQGELDHGAFTYALAEREVPQSFRHLRIERM